MTNVRTYSLYSTLWQQHKYFSVPVASAEAAITCCQQGALTSQSPKQDLQANEEPDDHPTHSDEAQPLGTDMTSTAEAPSAADMTPKAEKTPDISSVSTAKQDGAEETPKKSALKTNNGSNTPQKSPTVTTTLQPRAASEHAVTSLAQKALSNDIFTAAAVVVSDESENAENIDPLTSARPCSTPVKATRIEVTSPRHESSPKNDVARTRQASDVMKQRQPSNDATKQNDTRLNYSIDRLLNTDRDAATAGQQQEGGERTRGDQQVNADVARPNDRTPLRQLPHFQHTNNDDVTRPYAPYYDEYTSSFAPRHGSSWLDGMANSYSDGATVYPSDATGHKTSAVDDNPSCNDPPTAGEQSALVACS